MKIRCTLFLLIFSGFVSCGIPVIPEISLTKPNFTVLGDQFTLNASTTLDNTSLFLLAIFFTDKSTDPQAEYSNLTRILQNDPQGWNRIFSTTTTNYKTLIFNDAGYLFTNNEEYFFNVPIGFNENNTMDFPLFTSNNEIEELIRLDPKQDDPTLVFTHVGFFAYTRYFSLANLRPYYSLVSFHSEASIRTLSLVN